MKNKKMFFSRRIIAILISISVLSLSASNTAGAYDYYDSVNQDVYFNVNDPTIDCDYAGTCVSEYGGNDEGEIIPTDFEAYTYGTGIGWYNFYKVLYVCVDYADTNGYYYASDSDRTEIGWGESASGTAIVYGEDGIEAEYGLETFTSAHFVRYYVPNDYDANGNLIEYDLSQTIYFGTTGNDIES